MSDEISKLRNIAEEATPGEWKHGCLPGINRRDNRVYADARPDGDWLTVLECGDMAFEDALHVATFDPPTVSAMLDVIEAGMQAVTSSQVDGLDSFTRRMDDLDSALVRARDLLEGNV